MNTPTRILHPQFSGRRKQEPSLRVVVQVWKAEQQVPLWKRALRYAECNGEGR